ncbi:MULTISPECIES: hypothetical protein [Streptomyces]|uniref:hypothetical protein n=1 Tax=Streptomyces TaxID=1883 RepID=UPI0021A77413|nr:hypothetical protein [Streptomyces atratus]MCT2542362.1 hypothetical protein [Streptomyces atratus]
MTRSDDELFTDAAKVEKLNAASQNEDLPPFVRDMAAHTSGVIQARLSDEHKQEEG